MSRSTRGSGPLRADRRYSGAKPRATGSQKAATPRKPAQPKPRRRRGGGGGRRGGGLLGLIAGLVRLVMRVTWGVTWRVGAVAALVIGLAVAAIYQGLPPAATLVDGRARGSVTLMDRDGDPFAWRGDTFGGVIDSKTVSPDLKHAILATEDRHFYSHVGVSPRGILGAVAINLREGRGALEGHGGSGITQQTAKLLCLGRPYVPADWKNEADYEADCRKGSLGRKVREAVYALAMEAKYSKDEILTIYMNRVYLGAGTYGFEAASQRYFGKSAAEVNPSEAAMLAGLLVAPTRYAPTSDLARSRARAETIIGLMEDEDYLSPTEAAVARANPAELSDAAAAKAGGYFADWIMESTPSFLSSETTEDVLIRTTYDKRIQQDAEAAMRTVFDEKLKDGSKVQAAIVVMSADGAVRAMVGGRNTTQPGQFNRATQALRQTGSAFKPFIYAAALDLGYSPNATVVDEPMTINVPGSGPWSPKNYTRDYAGRVTLTKALAESLNIPAVKVSEAVGRSNVRQVASDFGIKSELDVGPALALGTSETTLLQMTAAYAGILNGGSSVMPYGVTELRLMGDDAPLLGKEGGIGERVISQHAARELVWMMYQVIETGTGRRAKLGDRPAAGKTGTTSAARDAWFIGFTGDYVAGVWMGYDDNSQLSGTTGGGLPAEIWRETMVRVHDGLPVTPLPMDAPPQPAPSTLTASADQAGTAATEGTKRPAAAGPGPGAALNQAAEDLGNGVRRTGNAIGNALRSIFGGG